MTDRSNDPWSWIKFLKGPLEPRNYGKVLVYSICVAVVLLVLSGAVAVKDALFPPRPQGGTTSTIGNVEAGGVVKNITIQSPKLKQGVYLRAASDRASVGVFKEVLSNIDVSLGAGKDYDDDAFVEVETRFKF